MIVVVVVVLQPSLLVLDYWEEHLGGNGKNKRRKIPSFFFCRTQLSFWPSSKDRRKMSLINPIAKTRYPITQYFPFWPVRWSFEIDARLCLETTPKGYFFFTDSMAYGCALLYSTSPQATFFLLLLRIRLYDNEGRPAASSFHHQPVYWLQLKREASIYHSGRWGERKFTNELEGEREKANGKRNEDPRCRCLAWFRYSFLPFSPFLCIFSFTCTYFVARLIWSVLHGGKSCHFVIDTNDALDRYFPQKKKELAAMVSYHRVNIVLFMTTIRLPVEGELWWRKTSTRKCGQISPQSYRLLDAVRNRLDGPTHPQ